MEDRNEILKSAERFIETVKNTIPDYAGDHILNSDQSSFKYVINKLKIISNILAMTIHQHGR